MSALPNYRLLSPASIEEIRSNLLHKDALSKIYGLSLVDSSNADSLINEIKICAYDFRPLVRKNAYQALAYAVTEDLTEILGDALRDTHPDAYKAAIALFDAKKAK